MQGLSVEMPGNYVIALAAMDELNCSWFDLQRTPADLVEEALVRRAARVKWERRRGEIDEAKRSAKSGRA